MHITYQSITLMTVSLFQIHLPRTQTFRIVRFDYCDYNYFMGSMMYSVSFWIAKFHFISRKEQHSIYQAHLINSSLTISYSFLLLRQSFRLSTVLSIEYFPYHFLYFYIDCQLFIFPILHHSLFTIFFLIHHLFLTL
jgi:hypothetical protein